jgi:alpha-beta hydrolase superfamily lysophospholipase
VVICHGAGANRGNFIDFLSVFHTRGYNSLIFDARGHGDSDGHTCTFGLYETRDVAGGGDC